MFPFDDVIMHYPVCLHPGQTDGFSVTTTTRQSNDLRLVSGETDGNIVINSAVLFLPSRAHALQMHCVGTVILIA